MRQRGIYARRVGWTGCWDCKAYENKIYRNLDQVGSRFFHGDDNGFNVRLLSCLCCYVHVVMCMLFLVLLVLLVLLVHSMVGVVVLVAALVVFCGSVVSAVGKDVEPGEDVVRATIPKPGKHFSGKTPGDVANVLNKHLEVHASKFGHKVVACDQLTTHHLRKIILKFLQLQSSTVKTKLISTPFQAMYASRGDYRMLRYTSFPGYTSEWESNDSILSTNKTLENMARDGMCYEAALIYVHHLSDKVKNKHKFVVPLLPNSEVATNLHAELQKSSNEVGDANTAAIKKQVGDQVVCARCHLLPNMTLSPRQDTYVSPLTHEPFRQPPARYSSNGVLSTTLRVTTSRINGPVSMNVRSYEGMTPGPTLRVKAGDVVNITLINDLELPLSCKATRTGGGDDANFYRCPNVTNLHIHGLWVEPHDVYSAVFPNETKQLSYILPEDHHAGTNFYHPHFHGSVSLQLANGMAGVFIVEDDEKDVPSALAAMEEKVMVLSSIEYFNYTMLDIKCPYSTSGDGVDVSDCHNLDGAGSLETLRRFTSDMLPLNASISDNQAGYPLAGNYFIINGLYQPRLTLKTGEWQRWRIVNGAHQASISLSLPNCLFNVIAMDGVYLSSVRPKEGNPLVLPPGARADVCVMCEEAGLYYLRSMENPDPLNLGQQEGFNTGVLMLVDVSTESVTMEPPRDLPSLPSYLSDTRNYSAATFSNVEWDIVKLINNSAGLTDIPIYSAYKMKAFDPSLSSNLCVESNSGIAEWTIINPIWICNATTPTCLSTMNRSAASGPLLNLTYMRPVTLSHGFHMHTFKFQVVGDSNEGSSFDYKVGDWRDTITTPMAGWVKIRWRPNTFTGIVPFHCHMSPHSDRGMIATALVNDTCPSSGNKDWQPRLTNYTMPITTKSNRAQHLFDEGLQLTFGFAHDAAITLFNNSIQEDPECAMCYFGLSYASGPVINVPVCFDSPACGQGYSAAQKAKELALNQNLTKKEMLLITAINERYSNEPNGNQTLLFEAYAKALNASQELIENDADVAAFYSEAVMMLHCEIGVYHFYDKNGDPIPDIARTTKVLENALTLPTAGLGGMHPLVEHLYMHITEPSASGFGPNSAGRSIGEADDIAVRFKDTQWQHIQHMSGHIYLRVGRYGDVVTANKIAHASDATWFNNNVLPYGPAHNVAFLIYGACMDGQSAVAFEYGTTLVNIYMTAPDRPDGPGGDLGFNIPLTTFIRFGNFSGALTWEPVHSMPRNWPYQRVLGSYALGVAYAHLKNQTGVDAMYQELMTNKEGLTDRYAHYAVVAENLLLATNYTLHGDFQNAIIAAKAAADEQATWPYDEPPDFHRPSQQCLGQAYLNAKQWSNADAAFRTDLEEYPHNGWSLFGLLEAMRNQPEKYTKQEIESIEDELVNTWIRADYILQAACPTLFF
eukprot:m.70585 g.70585  ORF g.70585 m.70585 type:complete len:1412 (+) comp8315_c2_seq2:384-4619(+)